MCSTNALNWALAIRISKPVMPTARSQGRWSFHASMAPITPGAIGIMRQALHSVLKEAVARARVPVRLGVTVASLAQHDDRVAVRFTDGTHNSYELVVGADDANSKIRELVFGTECSPKYTGQAVWRATVSRPAEVKGRYSFYGPRNKAGFNPVSSSEMYVYLTQNLPDFVRISDGRLPQALREQLTDFRGLLAAAREEISDPKHIVYRPITSHSLPPPWHRGRVILVGDAAQPRRRTWQLAPELRSKMRSFSHSCCNQSTCCALRWKNS